MSPRAGFVLLDQIVPRLRSAIPQCVVPVGAEDHEELVQDAIVFAAQMMDRLEQVGKEVTPGNVAYYTILHMKSGRRSYTAGRADVMAPGTQLDAKSSVLSVEVEVGLDEEMNEPVTLGELLACNQDDPSTTASRRMDWEEFFDSHDHRYRPIARDMVAGKSVADTARSWRSTHWRVHTLKEKMARDLHEYLGDTAIADALHHPRWHGDIRADFEKAACRADRRRH